MLMIHVGPLYSALQAGAAQTPLAGEPVHMHGHLGEQEPAAAPVHHGAGKAEGPAWLGALKFCGYCELLTLNPPLTLSLVLALPLLRRRICLTNATTAATQRVKRLRSVRLR